MVPQHRQELANLILSYATRSEARSFFKETYGMTSEQVRGLFIRNGIYFPQYLATDLQ